MSWLTKIGSFFGGIGTTVASTVSGTNFKLYFHIAIILAILGGYAGMYIWGYTLKTQIADKDKKIEQLTTEVANYKSQVELKEAMIKNLENAAKMKEKQIADLIATIEKWKGNRIVAGQEQAQVDAVVDEIAKLSAGNKVTCRFVPLGARNVVVPPLVVKPIVPIVVPKPEVPVYTPGAEETPDTIVPPAKPSSGCGADVVKANYTTTQDDGVYGTCPDTRAYVSLINQLYGLK